MCVSAGWKCVLVGCIVCAGGIHPVSTHNLYLYSGNRHNHMKENTFIGDALYSDMISREKQLTVNSNNTVQPVALMRLGCLFPSPPSRRGE